MTMRPEYDFDYRQARPNRFIQPSWGRSLCFVIVGFGIGILLGRVFGAAPDRLDPEGRQACTQLEETSRDLQAGLLRPETLRAQLAGAWAHSEKSPDLDLRTATDMLYRMTRGDWRPTDLTNLFGDIHHACRR